MKKTSQRKKIRKKKSKRLKKRPSWDEYFLGIARLISGRSTCLRRRVGVVVVRDRRIIATGYNGAPANLEHCDRVGCLRLEAGIPRGERHELCRGLHGEQNAIIQAALYGASLKEATLYATHQPCSVCAKMIINAGIRRVIIARGYPDKMAKVLFKEAGVSLTEHRK